MFSSFRIGTLFGITVRVHFLFLVMLVFLGPSMGNQIWGPGSGPAGVLLLLGLFGLVLLHELGHSLVAMRFGIRVVDITLWPLGGMARMSHIPEDTKTEALIAIAGPMVNFALLAVSAPIFLYLHTRGAGDGPMMGVLAMFVWTNFALGAFNLIPAFPMDGGRVLRALLARNGDWVGATRKAVHVGRLLALFGGLIGLFKGIWLAPVIALWLWFVGGQELAAVRRRHASSDPVDVGELLRRAGFPGGASPDGANPAADAARAAPSRDARGFRTFGAAPGTNGAEQAEPAPAAGARAARDKPGFTADDVERLERFRGPLRQFGHDADDA